MRISGILFDKTLLFALGVYKERYYVSMKYGPQNVGFGAADCGSDVSRHPSF
jgi:hypothetical protein